MMKLSTLVAVAGLVAMQGAGSPPRQVTSGPHSEYHPRWHPVDPDTILYTQNTGESIDIFKYSLSTGAASEVPIEQRGSLHFDLTPDGATMVFDGREDGERHYNLFIYDLSRGSSRPFYNKGPIWLPIALHSSRHIADYWKEHQQDRQPRAGIFKKTFNFLVVYP